MYSDGTTSLSEITNNVSISQVQNWKDTHNSTKRLDWYVSSTICIAGTQKWVSSGAGFAWESLYVWKARPLILVVLSLVGSEALKYQDGPTTT